MEETDGKAKHPLDGLLRDSQTESRGVHFLASAGTGGKHGLPVRYAALTCHQLGLTPAW